MSTMQETYPNTGAKRPEHEIVFSPQRSILLKPLLKVFKIIKIAHTDMKAMKKCVCNIQVAFIDMIQICVPKKNHTKQINFKI